MRKYVLFDLDGTLTDPQEGITNSVAFALQKFGIETEDKTTLYKFIGPPLKDSFVEYYGFSSEEAEKAVEAFREYFQDRGIFENKVYPKIPALLRELTGNGRQLILATSKPLEFAERILEHFNLKQYFADVQGSNMDGSREKKDEVITFALEKNRITNLSEAVMVGDRLHDILGAQKCGLQSIGVLFGYGSREELTEYGADYIAEDVEELRTLLFTME